MKKKQLKRIEKYASYTIGMIMLGIAFNMIFLPNNYFSYGTMSIGIISNNFISPIVVVVFFNIISFFLSYVLLDAKKTREAFIAVFAFPLVLYVTSLIPNVLYGIDRYLIIILGGFLAGYGYGLVFKYDMIVDGFDILELAIKKLCPKCYKNVIKIINGTLLLICFMLFGFEQALYSAIIFGMIVYISNRIDLGISDSKTFYIITNKEKEIKEAIMDSLSENLTTIDVEGGFSKKKKKLIVSVINTREYYMLRELVKSIDEDAFITIIDSYQVINDKKINEK